MFKLASYNMAENGIDSINDVRQLRSNIIYMHGNLNRFALDVIGIAGRYRDPTSFFDKIQNMVSNTKTQRQTKGDLLLDQIRGLSDITSFIYALHSQMENDFHQRYVRYSETSLFVQIINLCYPERHKTTVRSATKLIQHFITIVRRHKQVFIHLCSAVFQAFACYEHWFQSKGKYFSWRNTTHHQAGVARARRLNSDISVHIPDLEYIMERLFEHMDFNHKLYTPEKSRLNSHSYDSFLLMQLFPGVNLTKFENRVKYKDRFLNWLERALSTS